MEQKEIWDNIAEEWDRHRVCPVEEAENFLSKQSGKILDLGCGSGRNFIKSKNLKFYGVDFSTELLKLARKNAKKMQIDVELKKSETAEIPYDNNFFDSGVFVRVLHCVEGKEQREKSLRELFRVLKPNAIAIISVWSRKQDRIKNKNKECFIPWTVGKIKYFRYTYIYDRMELENILKKVGFKINSLECGKNIVAVVTKPCSSSIQNK